MGYLNTHVFQADRNSCQRTLFVTLFRPPHGGGNHDFGQAVGCFMGSKRLLSVGREDFDRILLPRLHLCY